ncbi:hypothetical protein PInf_015276 [Phytophthora infestans]|nr:hypothetical protein PInf_015276 [Phytophthora infestans]
MFLRTAFLFASACLASVLDTSVAALTNGHDLSSTVLMETIHGAQWINTDGNTTTIESIFTEGGMDAVRLRIWTDGEYDLNYTLALAQRFSKAGFKIYLDMHFSDTWADPHHQNIPAAWDNSSVATLAADLQAYVTSTLQAFTDGGIDLDILSLGNEITIGFLWPTGKLTTARQGVTDAVATGTKKPEIMIHVDNGWNYTYVSDFFTGLFANGTVTPDDVDVFGFSFYPFYGVEATIQALDSSLTQLAKDYNKPLYVAETNWPVACENVTLSADYPVSAEGQTQWVTAIKDVLEGLPNGLGAGIFYWEPAYLSVASLVNRPFFSMSIGATGLRPTLRRFRPSICLLPCKRWSFLVQLLARLTR